ncbi:MAG: fasciclin domain-containing protein [Prevotellaceae bacterium]|nr:fasciclin domain-containing protein [Prevotellaceae bacterium]
MMSACSDKWDEHYEASQVADGSIWHKIVTNSDLSNFAKVIESCGYKSALDGKQVFTVFAPTNQTFSEKNASDIISLYNTQKNQGIKDKDNAAIKEFIQNHIALYNYSASASKDETIRMLNGKMIHLTQGQFANTHLLSSNILTTNGVLFTIDKQADYSPNIMEMLKKDPELDSVANFIYAYNEYEFDPLNSVPGEIVDGKQQYLDSVTVLYNKVLNEIGRVDSEDSTFYMAVPCDTTWKRLLAENEQYFQYDKGVQMGDSLMNVYPRLNIIKGSVFSETCNPKMYEQTCDSLMSVNAVSYSQRYYTWGSYDKKYYQYDYPNLPGGVLYDTESLECSNGVVKKAKEWRFNKLNTFMQEIVMEGESSSSIDSVDTRITRDPVIMNVTPDNPYYGKVSGNGFVAIEAAGTVNTKSVFNIANVLSNVDYDVYVVTVPAVAGDTLAPETQRKPSLLCTTIYYHDQNGKEVNFKRGSRLTTDPDKVDSVFIGTFRFPTCSWNLDKPQIKMLIESQVSNSQINSKTHTRTLRIDCIVFKPREN